MTLPPLAPDTALFLDIDGTLLEFKEDAEAVRAPETLRETLGALQQKLHGALAMLSGRELPSVDRVFAPLELAAAGDHGAEIRFAAAAPPQPFATKRDRDALDEVFAEVNTHFAPTSGVRIDNKRFSLAFDYRGAKSEKLRLGELVRAAVVPYQAILQLMDGASCFDVKVRAEDKGTAIKRFLAVPPFRGRVPIYIGDTGTDEHGFAAALAAGGRAIRVVNDDPKENTLARETLATPAELHDWLARSAAALA